MDTLLQDLRYAARMLRKSPGFTVVAILALALGIGATTAIFSVVNAVLLQPLPFADPERLVVFHRVSPRGNTTAPHSYPDFVDFRNESHLFEKLAAFAPRPFAFTGTGEPEQLAGAGVSADFFPLLGPKAERGRLFVAGEDERGRGAVAVLSHGLWKRRFGADPGIVGRTVTLDGRPHEVVGILPPSFRFLFPTDVWIPLQPTPEEAEERRAHFLMVVGRLRPGVTLPQAQAELESISAEIGRRFPEARGGRWGVNLVPMLEDVAGPARPLLLTLMGAVGLVLLIACANIASLTLARAATRRREIGIRFALGAGGARVVRQLLTESVLLALLGGVAGVALAFWSLGALTSLLPADVPRLDRVRIDVTVLAFTIAVSVVTGLLFGILPALQVRKPPTDALREGGGGRTSAGPTTRRIRASLLGAEVALALVLLVGAALLLKSFARLLAVDPGFDPENVLLVELPRAPGGGPGDAAEHVPFYREVLERTSELPGVRRSGLGLSIPLVEFIAILAFRVEGQPADDVADPAAARVNAVSPGYLSAMGIPLARGRDILASDVRGAERVALVNEALARQAWPGEDPIGKRIDMGGPPRPGRRGAEPPPAWTRVVGVVRDVRNVGLHAPAGPELYLPYEQSPWPFMTLVLRTDGEPMALAEAVRREVRAVDPRQPVAQIRTLKGLISEATAPPRSRSLLVGAFAALALALAAVGIYGVVSHWVANRTYEIGLRVALGAQRRQVLRLAVSQGMAPVVAGAVLGILAALAAARLLSTVGAAPRGEGFIAEGPRPSLLYDVSFYDPIAFAGAIAVLVLAALLASWLPARRAAAVDPAVALRAE